MKNMPPILPSRATRRGDEVMAPFRLDPVAALVVAAVAVREGVASWRGEGCADLLLTKFG